MTHDAALARARSDRYQRLLDFIRQTNTTQPEENR